MHVHPICAMNTVPRYPQLCVQTARGCHRDMDSTALSNFFWVVGGKDQEENTSKL